MWTLDDLQGLNPRDSRQSASFLSHILNIGAASETTLCESAALLEGAAGPYVVAFAQLPFVVDAGEHAFKVKGWREGVVVELRFREVRGAFNQAGIFGQLKPGEDGQGQIPDGCQKVAFTQVTGIVRLWNKRARLHVAYLNCFTPSGLRNEIIGRVEDWMDTPEAKMPLPARRYAPLTAQAFQAEVARRVRTELLRATQAFLRAYSVANLEQLPSSDTLFGYFVMVAPGRIACAAPPLPIAAGLCATGQLPQRSGPYQPLLLSLLDKNLPVDDRFLGQLMAMHRLLKQGEPELALIGCVTAIEWFLNDKFAELVRRNRAGRDISASIAVCLRAGVLGFLTDAQREALLIVARARNAIVHGPPPTRGLHSGSAPRQTDTVNEAYVRSSLFLALEIYRAVNLQGQTVR